MDMSVLTWLGLAGATWIGLVAVWHGLVIPKLRATVGGSAYIGLLWTIVRVFCRLWHRARFTGEKHIPPTTEAGPLIIVSNHTGSIDPFLIQAGCPFFIRWMMGADMMSQIFKDLWQLMGVIPVDRTGRDLASAREAIRHVKNGGVVGIFPEGRIVNPPERIWPFFEGVGFIIKKTQARVLLVWISGTPATTDTFKSLLSPSRSHVHFIDVIEFADDLAPSEIVASLRQRLAEASGWPLVDRRTGRDPASSGTYS